jgi:hypothetical protein
MGAHIFFVAIIAWRNFVRTLLPIWFSVLPLPHPAHLIIISRYTL